MKTLALIAVLALSVLKSTQVLACSPPPSPLYVQPGNIARIVASREVFDALQALGAESILEIKTAARGYLITATNNCSVNATIEYLPSTQPGMCPAIKGVKILESGCSN